MSRKLMTKHVNTSSSDVDSALVFPRWKDKRPVVRYVYAIGGSAGSDLRYFAPSEKSRTKVQTAIVANGDLAKLDGDTGVNDTLNGNAIAANDWLLLKLDDRRFLDQLGEWQLMLIAGVANDTSGVIHINDLTAMDGEQVPAKAAAVGNEAHCILDEDVWMRNIGAATYERGAAGKSPLYIGYPGFPLAVALEAAGATAHELAVTVEYVDW